MNNELTGLDFGDFRLPASADARLVSLLELVRHDLQSMNWCSRTEFQAMRKVRDQLEGGARALSETYHPDLKGLNEEQQARARRMRKHVNLVEPAMDRLVNSIHAGRVTRKVGKNPDLHKVVNKRAHQAAMARLCENAFAFGTGFLVPIRRMGGFRYWHPDPLYTVLVVDPMDVTEVLGIVQFVRDESETKTIGLRFVGKEIEGTFYYETQKLAMVEHGLPFAPVIVAYGRDQRHRGKRYGKSLVTAAADGSVDVTDNALNLKLLRDRQMRALLLLFGEPSNSEDESGESTQNYLLFKSKEENDGKFIQPESRLEQVIMLTERLCVDTSIGTGLPLDTFRPELIAGTDASATAARNRAFPLQQKMVRLNTEWEEIEECTIVLMGALREPANMKSGGLEEFGEGLEVSVKILPSMPEAEAETLSNWQQRTEKFMSPIEEAIEFYAGHLPEQTKKELARKWRMKFDPESNRTELFQYHVEGGVLTVNEIRERLGLPAVVWGEITVPELSKLGVEPNPEGADDDGSSESGSDAGEAAGAGAGVAERGSRGERGANGNTGQDDDANGGNGGDPGGEGKPRGTGARAMA